MLFGPALIHYKPDNGTNITQHFTAVDFIGPSSANSTQTEAEVSDNIDIYLEILAGVSCLLFLLFLLYFPSKPPHPPAPSSAIARTAFLPGIKAMLTNKDVLLACFGYSISFVSLF